MEQNITGHEHNDTVYIVSLQSMPNDILDMVRYRAPPYPQEG